VTEQHPAAIYLTTLFSGRDIVCLCFIHGVKTYAAGNAVTENRFVPLADVVSPKGVARLIKRNEDGWNCFVSMAPFKRGSETRTKGNIAEIRHAFLDIDEDGDERLADVRAAVAKGEMPHPTIVVQSSPHKFQIVWNVEGLTVAQVEALNENVVLRFKGDPASTDAGRVLRIPGLRNLKSKYADKPLAQIVARHVAFLPLTIEDFCIPQSVLPDTTVHVAAASEEVQAMIELLKAALDAARVVHQAVQPWADAFKFVLDVCPWGESHANGLKGDAMCGVMPSAKPFFKCLHKTCAERNWTKDFRPYLEAQAGRKLKFGTKPAKKAKAKNGGV